MNIDNFSINILLNDNKNNLYLELYNNNFNINLKYELFGNKNLYSYGVIKCKNSFIPTLKFKILNNNIFLLKIKIFNKTNNHSLFKFFDINEYKPEENLSMSIEDLNKYITVLKNEVKRAGLESKKENKLLSKTQQFF